MAVFSPAVGTKGLYFSKSRVHNRPWFVFHTAQARPGNRIQTACLIGSRSADAGSLMPAGGHTRAPAEGTRRMAGGMSRQLARLRMRTQVLASVGLFAVAILQVSIASHQFEHLADDSTQYCRVCVQLDRLDDCVSPSTAPDPVVHAPVSPSVNDAIPAVASATARFHARAPPVSS